MTKRSRRKKAPLVSNGRRNFTIVIDAQKIVVAYRPHWMTDMGQFEFRSPHRPPRRIPISETGYLCHFADMEDVEAATSPQDFARDAALGLLRSRRRTDAEDGGQLPLF